MLRTIGTTTRQLVAQSAIGAGAIGLVAGLVGVPVGWWVFRAVGRHHLGGGRRPRPDGGPPAWLLLAVVAAGALVAAAAGAVAAAGVARRPAAELVRYE